MATDRCRVNEKFTGDDLAKVRSLVQSAATTARIGAGVDDLVVAVNEVAANAVLYAGGQGRLSIEQVTDGLVVEVRDNGPGLPPGTSAKRPPPDAVGGRGLWMIGQLCQDVDIVSSDRGVTVRLFMARA